MVIQYYTLLKIINEFSEYIGMEVIEVFTQEKDTLMLSLADPENEIHIEISTDNKYSSIFSRNNFSRAKKNTTDLFKDLVGDILQNIEIVNEDRIIKFTFLRTDLYCFLFGRGSSNIYAVAKNDIIIEAFENNEIWEGKKLEIPEKGKSKEDPTIWEFISRKPFLFGKYYSEIFFEEYKIDKNDKVINLNENNKTALINNLNEFKNNLLSSNKYFLHKTKNDYLFSLIKLNYPVVDSSDKLSELIRKKLSFSKKEDDLGRYSKVTEKKLLRKIKKAEGKLISAENYDKSLERARRYKHFADILMSQPNPKEIIGEIIRTKDFENNPIEIKLEENFNLIENATKYYEKAKKAEKEAEVKMDSIEKAKKELDEAKILFKEFEKIDEPKKLRKFIIENSKEIGIDMGENKDQESKFRHFEIQGWDFFAGKNAANNDELTMKFAKPHDIWFHARGVSGSHCIIRKDKKDKIPKEILKKAAGLAAYYSQARKGKYIPVAYTEKKYVRKPKGANTGAVIMQKEEVIMVDPIDPQNL